MIILTEKKVDEIIKRIMRNEIIGAQNIEHIDAYVQFHSNNEQIAQIFRRTHEIGMTSRLIKRYEKGGLIK